MTVPFLDLRRETARLRLELDATIDRVVASGRYILTDELERFEEAFAAWCGTSAAIGVASGTDAITIGLLAAGVEPGGEVITAANTCVPTIAGIERAGAVPVLADVDPITYTIDPTDVAERLTPRTRAIVPVHLYGQMADLGPLLDLATERGLIILEDCAQAHGATWHGRRAGTVGHAGAFSFYPTKNLGALGDAGAIVTGDPEIAARARSLRNYGERGRFEHVLRGLNSRLDSLQAGILSVKLEHLDEANDRRRELAQVYEAELAESEITVPVVGAGRLHAYHLYVVQVDDRDAFRARLDRAGIGSAVHYPLPVHRQPAYTELGAPGGFPVAESLAARIVSLPFSADHTELEIREVAAAATAAE